MRHLTIERRNRVEVWTLRRLPSDEVDGTLLLEIAGAVSDFHASPEVDVLLVWSAAGDDARGDGGSGPAAEQERMADETSSRLTSLRKPLIAVLDGDKDADWLWLILHCDLRLAATDLAFAMPDVDRGSWAPMGIARLCDVVGRERTLEWLWFRRTIDAGEALRRGLVDRVVPRARLRDAAWEMATALTREHRRPEAVEAVKRAVAGAARGAGARGVRTEEQASPARVAMAFWGADVPSPGAALETTNGVHRGLGLDRGEGSIP